MKGPAVFLVLSLVVMMAEPAEGFFGLIHHVVHGISKYGRNYFLNHVLEYTFFNSRAPSAPPMKHFWRRHCLVLLGSQNNIK
uniref:Uncharacterized protein n=1 Tax=Fundulus heteroclitus TaxID=8078 RepID=A0A3Q2QPQ4_FUNHE